MSGRRYAQLKREFDVIAAGVSVIFLAPAMMGIALMIRVLDGSPVIFRQVRMGKDGRPFTLLKFRTMPVGTEQPTRHGDWTDGVPDGFVFKSGDKHPSPTRLGLALRKSSLDELPQLVNILRGDLSLVGPRPEVMWVAQYYNARQRRRLEVRPGLTGLAQVRGRAEQTHGEKIDADLEYIDNASLLLDIKIIKATFGVVARGAGAY